nr:hypothetical protein [uncultured Friedmanniella sp.]
MTTVHADADSEQAHASRPSQGPARSALSARRWFLIVSPVLAGLFAVVGAYADPAVGLDGEELWRLYAANPDALQFKSLGFHWSYAFWFVPALLIAPYVRGRGAWLANLTAAVGFVGISTLPGLLFVDWYDSAVGQQFGVEGNVAVNERMEAMWGIVVFTTPGVVGLMLSLPLTALTMWRAGLARWWVLVPVAAGYAAFIASGISWWGCALMTLCFAAFAVLLARATRPASFAPVE